MRRKLAMMLSDEAFNAVPSLMNSDSAMAFALFLNNLPDMDSNLPSSTLLAAINVSSWRLGCGQGVDTARGSACQADANAKRLSAAGL